MNEIDFRNTLNAYYRTNETAKKHHNISSLSQGSRISENLFLNKNYQTIKAKPIRLSQPSSEALQKIMRMPIKKKVLNDYIDVVNRRKEIVDNIQASCDQINKLSIKSQQCFVSYYKNEAHFDRSVEKMVKILRPENQFVKQILKFNEKKIKQILSKTTLPEVVTVSPQRHIRRQTIKAKLFEMINKSQNEDKTPIQEPQSFFGKVNFEKVESKQEKYSKLKDKIIEHQLKCQGEEPLKLKIFMRDQKQESPNLTKFEQFKKNASLPDLQIMTPQNNRKKSRFYLESQGLSPIRQDIKRSGPLPQQQIKQQKSNNSRSPSQVNDSIDSRVSRSIVKKGVIFQYQENQLEKEKQFQEILSSTQMKDVFHGHKKSEQLLDKYYYNNAKVKRNSVKDSKLYLRVVSQDKLEDPKSPTKSRLSFNTMTPQNKNPIINQYQAIFEQCNQLNEETIQIQKEIKKGNRQQKQEFKKLKQNQQVVKQLTQPVSLRTLTGPNFPISPDEAAKFQIIEEF